MRSPWESVGSGLALSEGSLLRLTRKGSEPAPLLSRVLPGNGELTAEITLDTRGQAGFLAGGIAFIVDENRTWRLGNSEGERIVGEGAVRLRVRREGVVLRFAVSDSGVWREVGSRSVGLGELSLGLTVNAEASFQVASARFSGIEFQGDRDGDGLPDEFEVLFGLNPDWAGDVELDLDGDGRSNRSEFIGATNPADYYNGESPVLELASGFGEPKIGGGESFLFGVRVRNQGGDLLSGAPVWLGALSGPVALDAGLRLSNESGEAWAEGSTLNEDGEVLLEARAGVARLSTQGQVFADEGNGLPDVWELEYLGVVGVDITGDPDRDGVSTGLEYAMGSNPGRKDSDGDGVPDGRGRSGLVLWEQWRPDQYGNTTEEFRRLESFPQAPDYTRYLSTFESPVSMNTKRSGTRMRAWLTPEVSGLYQFFVTGEANVDLYFSTTGRSADKKRICRVEYWAGWDEWDRQAGQASAPIELVAGEAYYVEVLDKSEGAVARARVGWKPPGVDEIQPVPSSLLQAFGAEDDADDDRMDDADEFAAFGDLEQRPEQDFDADGISNNIELSRHLDPAATDSDGDGRSDAADLVGYVTQEVWLGEAGSSLSALATLRASRPPDLRMVAGAGLAEISSIDREYGSVVRGFLTPSVTGTHWFRAMDGPGGMSFLISTDESHTNLKALLSKHESKSVALIAGRRYYFELLHKKHATGPARALKVEWSPPGGTFRKVDASALSPVDVVSVPLRRESPQRWRSDEIRRTVGSQLCGITHDATASTNGLAMKLWAEGNGAMRHADDILFVHNDLPGDGEIVALLDKMPMHPTTAQAGLMIRQDTGPSAPAAYLFASANKSCSFQIRSSRFGTSASAGGSSWTGPLWLKLVRSAGWVYAYTSLDGSHWRWLGEAKWEVEGPCRIGVFAASRTPLQLAHVGFSKVHVARDLDGDGIAEEEGAAASTLDSDLDGYTDWEETLHLHSDPHAPDLSPAEIAAEGAHGYALEGNWTTSPHGIAGFRGKIAYDLEVTRPGIYRVALTGTPALNETTDTVWQVVASLNGRASHRLRYDLALGQSGTVRFFTPWLLPGRHRLEVVLHNVSTFRSFRFQGAQLEWIPGIDLDGNGVPDWMQATLQAHNRITSQSPVSFVSPFCFEGESRWHDLVTVSSEASATPLDVTLAPADGWFTNVPLRHDGPTTVEVQAEGGAWRKTHNVEWLPLDPLAGLHLKIRRGDALLLDGGDLGLTVTIAKDGVEQAQETLIGLISRRFDEPGMYTFTTVGDSPVVTRIEVVAADFSEPAPVAARGAYRDWLNPNVPAHAVIEHDARMEWIELAPPAEGGRNFRMRIDAAEPRHVLARLQDGTNQGPILDQSRIKGVRVSTSAQSGIYELERLADGTRLVEMAVVVENLNPELRFKLEIYVAGVTFEDGTLVRWLTAEDFDDTGTARVRFLAAAGTNTSACHRLYLYQGNTLIQSRFN